ncbi:hypothetical protein MMC18_000772 [Xylographa bjoerkii]|nr:hypothetical protein [Xylographa bjoerkii]
MKIYSAYAIPGEGVVSSFRSTTTHILIGLSDGKIHVFDTNGGHVHSLLEPTGSVWALAAFQNTLLNGGKDGSVRVWDMISGTQLRTLQGHSSLIRSLYWAQYPDHQAKHYAASGSSDGQIRIWDVNSGHCIHVLLGHEATVYRLETHGDILVSTSRDCTARIWCLGTGKCLFTLRGHSSSVMSLVVERQRVITSGLDGEVRLWSLADGSLIALLARHTSPINNLSMHASTIIASTANGWLFAWSLITYQRYWARKAHDYAVTTMDVYNGMIVSGGKDGGGYEDACGLDAWVRVWNLDAGDGNAKEEDAGGEGASSLPEGGAVSDKLSEWGHDQRGWILDLLFIIAASSGRGICKSNSLLVDSDFLTRQEFDANLVGSPKLGSDFTNGSEGLGLATGHMSNSVKVASAMLFLRPLPPPSRRFAKSFLRTIATSRSSRAEISPPASLLAAPSPAASPPTATVTSPILLSYHVHRTASKQLPVYHLAKRGGNLHQTRIRKIDGSINDLRNELQLALRLKDEHIVINQITRHIIIKGWKKAEVDKFLKDRSF